MTVPFSENGGFFASNFYLMLPVQTSDLGLVYVGVFDPTSFNDLTDSSYYAYRQEDVNPNRVPTVRRIILTCRDLGATTITVTVQGVNDSGNQVSSSQTVNIGTVAASMLLQTVFVDVQLPCFRPQVTITRAAGAGALSIVRTVMVLEVEDTSL